MVGDLKKWTNSILLFFTMFILACISYYLLIKLPSFKIEWDYFIFGAPMPGRKYTSSNSYRYGFNGKENDKETVSTGDGTQDFGARIYNPALGRFLSVDPDVDIYPFMSPFCYAANSPLKLIDEDGKGPRNPQRGANFGSGLRVPNHLEMRRANARANFGSGNRPKPEFQPSPKFSPSSAPYGVMNITNELSGEVNPKYPYNAYHAMEIIGKALDNVEEYRKVAYVVQDGEYNDNTGAWYPPLTVTKVYVAIPKEVQEQEKAYRTTVQTTAQGKLTTEEFKNLPIEEQTMRYNSAKFVTGSSPQETYVKKAKEGTVDKPKAVSLTSGQSASPEPLKAVTTY